MTRNQIIEVFVVRAAPADREELRRKLERMTLDELEEAYRVIQLEAKEDEVLRINAERAANAAMHQYHVQQTRKPQREAEEKVDRKTFAEAARTLQSFALNEANFSVIRSTIGPNFTVHSISQALASNALSLSPATQQELDEWTREAIQAHNQRLLAADIPTLRKLAREAGARGQVAPPLDEIQKVREVERDSDSSWVYPPLPEEFLEGNQEVVLDAAFIKKCSKETLKFLIKRYGSKQIDEALRTRKPDASPLW